MSKLLKLGQLRGSLKMVKKPSDLPIIEKNIDKIFTKDSNKILKELLNLFIKETPKIRAEINLAFQKKQQQKLKELLHKLLGSCVYCGWIRLKFSIITLENAITQHNYSNELLEQFNSELEIALDKAKEITHS